MVYLRFDICNINLCAGAAAYTTTAGSITRGACYGNSVCGIGQIAASGKVINLCRLVRNIACCSAATTTAAVITQTTSAGRIARYVNDPRVVVHYVLL